MPSRSSIVPAFVEPALATTANGPAGSARSSAAASAGPVRRPRSSWGTESRSTSITRAADATDECTVSAHAICQRGGRSPPRRLGGCVARRDQGRKVARRAARDEAAAGSGGHPRELGEPSEHLVLRPHGAPALEPAPPVDLGRAHREVEEHAGLAGGARHEREEARVVGGDGRGREHVRPDPERLVPADALGRDRGSGGRGELVGRHRVVERLRIRDAPARVVHDGLGQRVRFRGVLVHRRHRAPLSLGASGRVAHRSG